MPRQREKKIVNEPMEIKQSGKARYGSAQADASYASRIAQQRGKTRTTQQKVKDFYNSPAGKAVKNAYDRAFNNKSTNTSATKAKAAYDDGNGTTFLNSKPKNQIKDQQNNQNVYGKVTAVNGKPVKKKKGR